MPISTLSNIVINNIQNEPERFFSGGDYVAMAVGFLSLVGGIIINNRMINAEVRSKSRIEWVESIRVTASNLLSNYHMILKAHNFLENEKERINDCLCEANRLTQLLVLHFSDDSDKNQVNIDDKTTNEGKNSVMANYISKVFDSFFNYYHGTYTLDKNIDQNRKIIMKLEREIRDGYYLKEYDDNVDEFDGMSSDEIDTLTNSILSKQRKKEYLERLIRRKKNLYIMLDKLSDSIRIYGKIEWEQAKKIK